MKNTTSKKLTVAQSTALLKTLKARFDKFPGRHKGIEWPKVESKLLSDPEKLWSLNAMEETDGEPDVVGIDKKTGGFIFTDCCAESPKGRRSICYDGEALASRKEHKPADSAINMAEEMGIEVLTEEEYFELQKLGHFDAKTSSWLKTPADIRKSGGAIMGDYRYGRVFIGHNGAESYYAARGFRGKLIV